MRATTVKQNSWSERAQIKCTNSASLCIKTLPKPMFWCALKRKQEHSFAPSVLVSFLTIEHSSTSFITRLYNYILSFGIMKPLLLM